MSCRCQHLVPARLSTRRGPCQVNFDRRPMLFRLFQLPQLYPEENLEKFIPCLAGPDSFYIERNHMDLEADLR